MPPFSSSVDERKLMTHFVVSRSSANSTGDSFKFFGNKASFTLSAPSAPLW